MPNWCNNSLIVTGDQATIDDFKSKTVEVNESGTENFTMNILLSKRIRRNDFACYVER